MVGRVGQGPEHPPKGEKVLKLGSERALLTLTLSLFGGRYTHRFFITNADDIGNIDTRTYTTLYQIITESGMKVVTAVHCFAAQKLHAGEMHLRYAFS